MYTFDMCILLAMMAASQGYQYDFLDSVPEDYYYCKKCSLVARRLTVTSCCGEHYCHACTISKTSLVQNVGNRPSVRITSLKVYCSLKGKECDWSGMVDQLKAHLNHDLDNCQYVDNKCPLNCQQAIPKNKVEQYVREECVKREHDCQHCNFKATYEEVVDIHLPECMYVPLQCPNLCGVSCDREVMEDHMKVCRLEEVTCEFSDMGCAERFRLEDQEEHTKQCSQKHLSLTAAALKLILQQQQQQQSNLNPEEKLDQEKEFQELKLKLQVQEQTIHKLEQKLEEQEKQFQEQVQQLLEKQAMMEQQWQDLKDKYINTVTKTATVMTRLTETHL